MKSSVFENDFISFNNYLNNEFEKPQRIHKVRIPRNSSIKTINTNSSIMIMEIIDNVFNIDLNKENISYIYNDNNSDIEFTFSYDSNELEQSYTTEKYSVNDLDKIRYIIVKDPTNNTFLIKIYSFYDKVMFIVSNPITDYNANALETFVLYYLSEILKLENGYAYKSYLCDRLLSVSEEPMKPLALVNKDLPKHIRTFGDKFSLAKIIDSIYIEKPNNKQCYIRLSNNNVEECYSFIYRTETIGDKTRYNSSHIQLKANKGVFPKYNGFIIFLNIINGLREKSYYLFIKPNDSRLISEEFYNNGIIPIKLEIKDRSALEDTSYDGDKYIKLKFNENKYIFIGKDIKYTKEDRKIHNFTISETLDFK